MTYSPDGAVLAVAVGGDVLLLDPATGQSLQTFNAAGDAVTRWGSRQTVHAWPPPARTARCGFGACARFQGKAGRAGSILAR